MNKQISLIVFLLWVFSPSTPSAEENNAVLRVIVPKNSELVYSLEGNNFVPMSDSIRITDKQLGEKIKPQIRVKPKPMNYSRAARTKDAGPQYLDDILPVGLAYVFLAPAHVPNNGKLLPINLNTQGRGFPSSNMPTIVCDVTSKKTSTGWTHKITMVKQAIDLKKSYHDPYKLNGVSGRRVLNSFSLDMKVTFNKKEQRVSKAKLEYKWELDKLEDPLPGGKQGKKKIKKHHYTCNVTFVENRGLETKYKYRVVRAIEMSKSHLLSHVRDVLNPDNANFKMKQSRRERVGTVGLALFALFKSGLRPDDKEVKVVLDNYISMIKGFGYSKDQAITSSMAAYDCSIILMMIEAIMNPPSKSTGKKSKYTKSKVSSKHKKILMSLAKRCMEAISQGSGHVWDYAGKRYEYSPGGYSRAQYAVLGLRSAKLLKLKVPSNVWDDILKGSTRDFSPRKSTAKVEYKLKMNFVDGIFDARNKLNIPVPTQQGGWGYQYQKPDPSKKTYNAHASFNMTCSGLGNLAMAYEYSKNKKFKTDATRLAMVNGLFWLQNYMKTMLNESRGLNYYSYYSFERVAVFYGIKQINESDWHSEMSERLMANQLATGQFATSNSSHCGGPGNIGTSAYALLFLKKATKPLKKYSVSAVD